MMGYCPQSFSGGGLYLNGSWLLWSVYDGLLWSVCDGLLWRAFWRWLVTILSLVYGSYEQVAIWDAMEGRFLAVEGYNG